MMIKANSYTFSRDKGKLDITFIHQYLSKESYWAKNIPLTTVKKSIDGSMCFGVYFQAKQVGFARVISDEATFAYLADVFIDPVHRRKGLSKKLLSFVLQTDSLKSVRRFMLATLDAHALYKQFGFNALSEPARFMELKPFESY